MNYTIHHLRHLRYVIGQNIHTHRIEQKLTLCKLAKRAGVSPLRMDQYELGKHQIRLEHLFRIACALQVGIQQLLDEKAEKKQEKEGAEA